MKNNTPNTKTMEREDNQRKGNTGRTIAILIVTLLLLGAIFIPGMIVSLTAGAIDTEYNNVIKRLGEDGQPTVEDKPTPYSQHLRDTDAAEEHNSPVRVQILNVDNKNLLLLKASSDSLVDLNNIPEIEGTESWWKPEVELVDNTFQDLSQDFMKYYNAPTIMICEPENIESCLQSIILQDEPGVYYYSAFNDTLAFQANINQQLPLEGAIIDPRCLRAVAAICPIEFELTLPDIQWPSFGHSEDGITATGKQQFDTDQQTKIETNNAESVKSYIEKSQSNVVPLAPDTGVGK